MSDLEFLETCFSRFAKIGALPQGGYTRLGYSGAEDEMHRTLAAIAAECGLACRADSAGNTFLFAPAHAADERYYLLGSHLDSVVSGGAYDGVAGVLAGLLVLRRLTAEAPELPVRAAAFRCEESASFGVCTIGSALFAGASLSAHLGGAKNRDGVPLAEALAARGLRLERTADDPGPAQVREYLELHIEQGRVLESRQKRFGVVTSIAGSRRYAVTLRGKADHSGATPMDLRHDALCAAAELVLALEEIGRDESRCSSVATVGILNNAPNVMNTIPGEVTLGVDTRSNDAASLARMRGALEQALGGICEKRGIEAHLEPVGDLAPVHMDPAVMDSLSALCGACGAPYMRMMSGAGHDASCLAPCVPTGMLFVPCRDGVSHNPAEHAEPADVAAGADILRRHLLAKR